MKKYNPSVLRMQMNKPFLSSKWRGNSQLNKSKGGNVK
jgi:hypothetical protein